MDVLCLLCHDKFARKSNTRYAFETPWDETETKKPFCSEDCEIEYLYSGDFSYFWCHECDREICGQNPENGWHIQYQDYDGDVTCLRCYMDLILENGIEKEKLESGQIQGMFFNSSNTEALDTGYKEVPGFKNFFIKDKNQALIFRNKALDLMDDDKEVVIGYESMAIDGSEGFATLMVKKDDS